MQHSFFAFIFSLVTIVISCSIGILAFLKAIENIKKDVSWLKFGLTSAIFLSFTLFFAICLIIS